MNKYYTVNIDGIDHTLYSGKNGKVIVSQICQNAILLEDYCASRIDYLNMSSKSIISEIYSSEVKEVNI